MCSVVSSFTRTASLDNFQQARSAGFQRTNLRLKIPITFGMTANVCENQTHHVCVKFAVSNESNRRNTQAFAVNVCCQTHRSRRGAAYVCVVGAVRYEEQRPGYNRGEWVNLFPDLPGFPYSHNKCDVGQMRAAGEGIIQGNDIARLQI